MSTIYLALLVAIAVAAYLAGLARGRGFRGTGTLVHSLPGYHGWFTAIAAAGPMLLTYLVWLIATPLMVKSRAIASLPAELRPTDSLSEATLLREIGNVVAGTYSGTPAPEVRTAAEIWVSTESTSGWLLLGVGLALGAAGFLWAITRLAPAFRARNSVERIVMALLFACSAVAVLTTVGILFSVLYETLQFFARYPWHEFVFGLQWSPQTAIREDQVGQSGAFGAVPLFAGTTLIMLIAMLVAGPIGLLSAIYMAEYASPRFRSIAKPMLEVLAGVPTVVFGFFAALTVAPFIRNLGSSLGLDVASESDRKSVV